MPQTSRVQEAVERIHFVGICGTAMASVAAAMKERGHQVTGSDQLVYPPMSTFLEAAGIPVMEGFDASHLQPHPDCVVIGNAISRGNPEAEYTLEAKLRYTSLPELLKHRFIQGKRSIVVTGTHGKTTVTSLLTWIFETHGLQPSYLVGGIPENLGRGARFTDSDWVILEGDEYDTAFFDKRSKFVHYLPEIVIINNLEFDHADIFRDLDDIQWMFRRLVQLIPGNGRLLLNGEDPNLTEFHAIPHCPVQRFGMKPDNDLFTEALALHNDHLQFRFQGSDYRAPLIGELNARNTLAAVAAARHAEIPPDVIQRAFDSFVGIKRRMQERGTVGDVTVIDDFGHHPTAIRETLKALRIRYPGRRLWAIFEPRTNTTRRKVLQTPLAEALALADRIHIAAIARIELLDPSERLDPEGLLREISSANPKAIAAYEPDLDALIDQVMDGARPGDVLTFFSNGGFGGIHDRVLNGLRQ